MEIKIETYNLEDAKSSVIEKMLEDRPSLKNKEYAKMLGISERHFYRLMKEREYKKYKENPVVMRKIIALENLGYEVKLKKK